MTNYMAGCRALFFTGGTLKPIIKYCGRTTSSYLSLRLYSVRSVLVDCACAWDYWDHRDHWDANSMSSMYTREVLRTKKSV